VSWAAMLHLMGQAGVRKEGRWRRLAISTAIAVIFLEVGLRLFVMGNFAQSKVLQRSENTDVCLELKPGFEVDYTGWLLKVPPSHISINQQGNRGPAWAPTPAPGVLRIAALGDSFTFGQGVEIEDSFPAVMGRELDAAGLKSEVLNFGVPGHATPQEVALVQDRVAAAKPDLVLIHVFANDMTSEESNCEYGEGGNQLSKFLLHESYVFRLGFFAMQMGKAILGGAVEKTGPTPGARFVESLGTLKALAEEEDFLVAVVLLTDRDMYIDSHLCRGCEIPHDLVGQTGLHVVDMTPVWKTLQLDIPQYFIPGEDHLSVDGNILMGRSLGGALAGWEELRGRSR
jgi:hypothetical protein